MTRLWRVVRMLDAGRLAGRHVLARWILRTVELLVALAYGGNLIQSAWHHLAGAGRHASSLATPIVIALAAVALGTVLLAERHHRRRQARRRDSSTGEQRSADPDTERRHVAAISLAWVVGGIVLACAATAIPVGPAILRAVVATAVACGGALRGWRIAGQARAPRPTWLLAATAARDEAPPGIGVPVVVAGTFVVAVLGATLRWPIGGLAVAIALVVAVTARRDVGRRWATEELSWWRTVATEVGAERVREVRAVRPDPVVWPAGVDATARQALKQLAQEFDDSSAERIAYEHVDRYDTEVPLDAAQAAVEERDARWGVRVALTPDRTAADADTAADRLGERLGESWAVVADASGLRISIMPCVPEALPSRVALVDLLPGSATAANPEALAVPFCVNAHGEVVAWDQALVPHILCAGETGAGKTIFLTGLITGALARGFSVAIAEVTKGGLDFLELEPWCSGFAGDLETALELVRSIYAEVGRRRALLHQFGGAKKWADLPAEVQATTPPLLFVFDELASALVAGAPPRGLPKRHPLVLEAEERLAATAELRLLLGKLARESRFVSVSTCLALQRADVSLLGGEGGAGGGELRSNLGFRILLSPPGNLPSREAAGMLFSGEATNLAIAELARLNDGVSRGLAVVHAEGGSVQAVRVAYHPPADVPTLLDRLGVPRHVGPRLGESAPPAREDAHPPVTAPSAPNVATVPAQPDASTVATAPGVPHAPSVPIVVRRPDGSVRRVVAQAPAPDGSAYGVVSRYRLVMGRAVAVAEHADDLVGLLIGGYDGVTDPVQRAMSRIRWARQRRLDAQARVAGPYCATVPTSVDERRVLAGVDRPSGPWTSAMPLVLVDADFIDDAERPAGNVVWLRTTSVREFFMSLAGVGLVDSFLDLAEASSAQRSDEEGVAEGVPEEVPA